FANALLFFSLLSSFLFALLLQLLAEVSHSVVALLSFLGFPVLLLRNVLLALEEVLMFAVDLRGCERCKRRSTRDDRLACKSLYRACNRLHTLGEECQLLSNTVAIEHGISDTTVHSKHDQPHLMVDSDL